MQRVQSSFLPTNVSPIVGFQLGIPSAEEIVQQSVVEVASLVNGPRVTAPQALNWLFDPKMGVTKPGAYCPTDGNTYIDCPGYFGHLWLARPVYFTQYLKYIVKVLGVVCWKCSASLMDEARHRTRLMRLPRQRRFEVATGPTVYKYKRCPCCHAAQPKVWKQNKESAGEIFAVWRPPGARASAAVAAEEAASRPARWDPLMVFRVLDGIADDTIDFVGMHPQYSRPSSMICRALPIAPPAVRPSVDHDSGQRAEDDITTIYVNVIKYNAQLAQRMEAGASEQEISKYLVLLQCAVTAIYSNKFPGATIAQNGGRPLQSFSDRHDGKRGRSRNNLNGKRVDFSARSVISGNPAMSVEDVGVPLEVCMNQTVNEVVTDRNRAFLQQLVINGPDVYPGARSVVRRGEGRFAMPVTVSLRHAVRESIVLRPGDVVMRHLQKGDYVFFNRQPSLHKPSIMAHRVVPMPVGQSFRLNLAATQTYNADFDGDEMNLHTPQTTAATNEARTLAHVSEQMIDASKTAPNLSFFQDSMLGLYRFSGEGLDFSLDQSMELLSANSELDLRRLLFGDVPDDDDDEEEEEEEEGEQQQDNEVDAPPPRKRARRGDANDEDDEELRSVRRVTSREILGQTLPAITMSTKNKVGAEVRLHNGRWLAGQADKAAVATGSRGVLHRICNDFGKQRCVRFIDDVQNLVTTWIAHFSSFSVGTGDLEVSPVVQSRMEAVHAAAVAELDALQTRFRLGLAENSAAWSNAAEFERQAWNVLSDARSKLEAAGFRGLAPGNRFLEMVHSGSKGNNGNVTQMAMGLCQQAVSGARAPYGFADRTLPMFAKYDDGAVARGYITRSYARGLQPADMFIHAVAGREGLIDTAIKTSGTGYIARKLRVLLEIAQACYGFTVRDHGQRIVQFRYGDDGFNSEACELQPLPLATMSLGELAMRYDLPVFGGAGGDGSLAALFTPAAKARLAAQEQDTRRRCREDMEYLLTARDAIVRYVFGERPGAAPAVSMPVNFAAIVTEVRGQMQLEHRLLDLTPLEAMDMVRALDDKLVRLNCGFRNPLFSACLHFWLNPRELLLEYRFNRAALALLLGLVELRFLQALLAPGEPVGVLAAQCIAEPATQMTLNTFHSTGLVTAKGNVTHGVPRLEELIGLTENTKKPALTLPLLPADRHSRERAVEIAHQIESLTLHALLAQAEVVYDPLDAATRVAEDADWLREFNAFQQQFLETERELVHQEAQPAAAAAARPNMSAFVLRLVLDARAMLDKDVTMDDVHFAVAGYFDGEGVQLAYTDFNASQLVLRVRTQALVASGRTNQPAGLDTSDHINYLKRSLDALRHNLVLRGVPGIRTVTPRKVTDQVFREDGAWVRRDAWVLDTEGSNLAGVLALEDLIDVNNVHCNDVREVHAVLGVMAARSTYQAEFIEVMGDIKVDYRHTSLLAARTTMTANMVAANHAGVAYDDIGPLAKMSFERHTRMSVEAAVHAEFDNMRGVTAGVMCGQHGTFGTGACRVLLDAEAYARHTVDEEGGGAEQGGEEDLLDVDARLAALAAQNARCRHVAIENNLAGSRAPDALPEGCLDDGYALF